MRPVRVVVIDDHEIIRAGLRTLLSREEDIHVVGVAATGEEGLRLIGKLEPDVAIVDYSLGSMSGVEVCEKITDRHADTSVIMLSTFLDDEIIQGSIQAGAKAYVYKDVEAHDLKQTIRMVAQGQAVLDPKVAGRVMRWASRRRLGDDLVLSPRETELLRLVAGGASNQEIAEIMKVSQNTVKTYLRRALEKLGCRSRMEAATAATRRGLI